MYEFLNKRIYIFEETQNEIYISSIGYYLSFYEDNVDYLDLDITIFIFLYLQIVEMFTNLNILAISINEICIIV